jgi:beta-lactam-binding protein with PASTA domain
VVLAEGGNLRASIRRARGCALSLFAVGALIVGPMLGVASPGGATGHAPVRMPNVVGDTRSQVFAVMAADQLFFATHGPGSADGNWTVVVAQVPAAGTLVPYRSTVSLTVRIDLAHQPRPAPVLVGLTRPEVYKIMSEYQLFFTTSGPGASNGTWTDVVSQSPGADVLVAWHSTMHLIVSRAVVHPKRAVPRLLGASKAQALALLAQAELGYVAQGLDAKNGTWTTVTKQSPAPGTQVAWHSTVVLDVSGPSPSTTTTSTTTTSTSTTTTYPGETTTTTIPPSTTTTIKAPTTTTTLKVKPKPSRSRDYRIGIATWYSYIPGQCATWYLPLGTRLVVRDLATGRAIVCLVTDHEASKGDHVVDLSETQFAELEPLWRGVIHVKVSW